MAWLKLKGMSGSPSFDDALFTLGKIFVALGAIASILGGLIDIGQALIALYSRELPIAFLLLAILLGALRIVLGYGYYLLFDMNKSGLLISIAKFFVQLGAVISIIFSPVLIVIGLFTLFKDANIGGGILILISLIMLLMGFGGMLFIDERDEIQAARKLSDSVISPSPS
jgi:hypothetical protein